MKDYKPLLFVLFCFLGVKNLAYGQHYWRHEDSPVYLNALSYADSNHFVSAGAQYGMYKSNDGMKTWQKIFHLNQERFGDTLAPSINKIAHPTANMIVAIVDSSYYVHTSTSTRAIHSSSVIKSSDGGKTWSYFVPGQLALNERLMHQVVMNDSLHGVIAQRWFDTTRADRLAPILFTNDGGVNWNEIYLPDSNVLINRNLYNEFGNVLSSPKPGFWFLKVFNYNSQEYELWKTTDFGKTWRKHIVPLDMGLHFEFVSDNIGYAIGYDIIGTKPHVSYTHGIIAKSTDGGSTWAKKEFQNRAFNHIDFLDNENGVVTSYDSILRTTDGGNNWYSEYAGHQDSIGYISESLWQIAMISKNNLIGTTISHIVRYIPNGFAEEPRITTPKVVQSLAMYAPDFQVPGRVWWYNVPGAEKYYIEFSENQSPFEKPLILDSTSSNSYLVKKLGDKKYGNVRVRTKTATSLSNWTVWVPFNIVNVVSVENEEILNKQLPYPNPATAIIHIPYKSIGDEEIYITIADSEGKLLNSFKSTFSQVEQRMILSDLQELLNGVYFVRISQGAHEQNSKITIAR